MIISAEELRLKRTNHLGKVASSGCCKSDKRNVRICKSVDRQFYTSVFSSTYCDIKGKKCLFRRIDNESNIIIVTRM